MAFYSKDIDLYAKDAMLNYIRSQQTEFEVVQGKISALISESELEELEDGHTTMYSRLADVELRADGFDAEFSEMDTKYNSVTGEITAMDSRLSTFSAGLNGLDSRITQTNTNLQNNYWTSTQTATEIQQSAESIMLQVSSGYATKNDLNQVNANLGARMTAAELKLTPDAIVSTVKQYSDVQCINLLSLSDLNEYSTTVKVDGYNASISLSASAAGGVRIPYTITETGKKYTLSFKFKKKSGGLRNIGYTTSSAYTVHRFAVDGVEQSGNLVTVADDQTEHSVVITFTRSSNLSLIIRINSGASVAVEIDTWEWQLEKGESATGWTPAIEDTTAYTQSMISQSATEIYAYADTIRLKAATLVWQASNSSMDSTGKLTCTSATIGGINVNATSIYSTGYTSGGTTNGFKLSNTGTFEWKATYSSLGSDGKLTISNATIGTGNASPIYIGNGKIYSGSHTTYDSANQGFYFDGDGKFGIGDASSYIRWTGSELNINANIVAKSLTLGSNVTVPASGVSGLASVATTGKYTDLANKPDLTVYISKGGTVGSTPQEGATGFVVSTSGLLTCSNAVVYGTIYSSNGTIGGIKISSGDIHTGSKTAYSSTSQGFYLGSDGTLGVGDGSYYLRWDGSNLNLSVRTFSWSATYSSLSTNGKLTITSAEIGNTSGSEIKIGNGYIYSGSHSSYASSYQGFYFDGNGYFGIGDSNFYLRWNQSNLDIKVKNFSWNSTYSNLSTTGEFECTYGNIGGIKIASNGIYATNGTMVTAIDANIGKIHVYRRISTSGSDFLLPSVNYSYFCASTNGVEATAVSTSSFSVGALPSDLSGDSSIGSIYFDVDSGGLGCYVDAYFNRVCIGNKSTSYGFYCTLSSYFSGEMVLNDMLRVLGGRSIRFGSSSANGFISESGSIKLSLGSAVNSGSAIVSDSNGRMKTLSASSRRYKNYLGELPDEDAERLLNLPVIEFMYKPGYLDQEDAGNGKKFAGLFAEDVAGQFDDATFKKDGLVENYSDRQLLVRLIKLCQIQQRQIDELKAQIAATA